MLLTDQLISILILLCPSDNGNRSCTEISGTAQRSCISWCPEVRFRVVIENVELTIMMQSILISKLYDLNKEEKQERKVVPPPSSITWVSLYKFRYYGHHFLSSITINFLAWLIAELTPWRPHASSSVDIVFSQGNFDRMLIQQKF